MGTFVDVSKLFDGPEMTAEVLEAGRAALAKMSDEDQHQIKRLISKLCEEIPQMEQISALEFFTRLGMYLARKNGSAQVQAGRGG